MRRLRKPMHFTLAASVAVAAMTAPMVPAAAQQRGDDDAITIEGEVSDILGNGFVLRDSTGSVVVETGPSWYRDIGIEEGDRLSVTGQMDDDEFDAFTIRRDGETITVREPGQRPPWSGDDDRVERRGGADSRAVERARTRLRDAGFADVTLEDAEGARLEFSARTRSGVEADIEIRRNGSLRGIDLDDDGVPPADLAALLPKAVMDALATADLTMVEEVSVRGKTVEVDGETRNGEDREIRMSIGGSGKSSDGRSGDRADLRERIEAAGFTLSGDLPHLDAGGTVRAENPYGETVTLQIDPEGAIVRETVVR